MCTKVNYFIKIITLWLNNVQCMMIIIVIVISKKNKIHFLIKPKFEFLE